MNRKLKAELIGLEKLAQAADTFPLATAWLKSDSAGAGRAFYRRPWRTYNVG